MRAHAPCGACRALVPADTGCAHWKPKRALGQAITARHKRERKQAALAKRPVAGGGAAR